MTQLTVNASEGVRLLQLFLLMTKLTRKASGATGGGHGVTAIPTDGTTHDEASGASSSRGYSVALQLTGKATEATGRVGGVTGVPTDDINHMKGQWSFG